MAATPEAPSAGAVAAVVLAAGRSSRFAAGGGPPKQLFVLDGEPLVRRTTRLALSASVHGVVVVTGHRGDAVARAVVDLDVTVVHNPDFAQGQSTSVRSGLAALGAHVDAALFLPIDQPRLETSLLDRLVDAWRSGRDASGRGPIAVPEAAGRRGAPVLFDRRFFPELAQLTGDVGGRAVLRRHAEAITTVAAETVHLMDLDRLQDLDALGYSPPRDD